MKSALQNTRTIARSALLLILAFGSLASLAQDISFTQIDDPDSVSTTSNAGNRDEISYAFVEDSDGAIFVAGSDEYSIFVGKCESSSRANFEWQVKIRGALRGEGVKNIWISSDGYVNIVSAGISRNADLDPGSASLRIDNDCDILWIKYTKTGTLISARRLTESIGNPYHRLKHAMHDASGNIYLYGLVYNIEGHVGGKDFDPTPASSTIAEQFYLAKYNGSGDFLWVK